MNQSWHSAKRYFIEKDNETKRLQSILGNLSEFKIICDAVPDDSDYNIKGSTFSRILCTFKDKILQVVLIIVEREELKVARLMYDSCMVYGNHHDNKELLEKLTIGIAEEFRGLNMKWSYKPHSEEIVIPDGWN